MKFEDIMNLILPPVGGVRSHITIPSGDYGAGEAQGRRYPSKIPHGGVDMSYIGGQTAKINQSHPDVHSPVSGTVTGVGEGNTKAITIRDANDFFHQILHTQTQSVIKNQKVFAGDKIGAMGNSGTQDQHVHYQIKDAKGNRVNPHAFWNQYLSEYQRYLDAIGANGSSNTLPGADASSTPSQPGNPQLPGPPPQQTKPPLPGAPPSTNPLPPRIAPSTIPWLPGDLPRNPRLPGSLPPGSSTPPSGSGTPPRPQPGPQPPVTQPQDSGQSTWQYLLQNRPLNGTPPPSQNSFTDRGGLRPPTTGLDNGVSWPGRLSATAPQTMNGRVGNMEPMGEPDYAVPGAFPENGAQPVGYLDGADKTGAFDPAASAVPLSRPRPQAPDASWPSAPVAPPALPLQNLTARVLRMKGVPDADIAAAISNPGKMRDLLNQYYGRRSTIAPDDNGTLYRVSQGSSANQPDQASTPGGAMPGNYLPFGWTGLPAVLR
jgi:murein DD-endopeptidase MepM/ murein hydrolase activator NlpD